MLLTQDEVNKGYTAYGFQNETAVVDPKTNSVIRRYQNPVPQVPTPSATPPAASSTGPLTKDQWTAQNSGSVDESAVREQTRKQMQAAIDATNNYFADLVRRENEAGDARLSKVQALNVNSGLSGSNFATSQDIQQKDKNSAAVRAIENERELKLQEIYGKIDEIARSEIKAKKEAAVKDAEGYSAYLSQAKEEALGTLGQLAGANIDLTKLDQPRRAYLFKAAGLDEALGELVYNSMKPKAAKIEYKAEKAADGKILLYGVDPTTGQLKTQRINIDIPEGYEPTYVDGKLYYKNSTSGDLIPAPMDQSLYTTDYKEYLLSKKDGYTGGWDKWRVENANLRRPVSNTYIGGSDLNTKDRAVFNSLVDKANKSPLIAAADRTVILDKSISDIKADPGNAAKQLNLSYSYIQALDTYQSAVREGELANLNSIDSKIGSLQGEIQKIQNGQIVRPEVAKQIADAAEQLVQTIKQGAKATDKKFASQAKVNGTAVEKAWNDYRAGFTSSYDDPNKLPGEVNLTDEEAYQLYLNPQGGQ